MPEPEDLRLLATETAQEARGFLDLVQGVATGRSPDTAIPMLLLALSQISMTGARLGAITDVLPAERFEADPGPDRDVDPVRVDLADLFEGLDDYADVVDPMTSLEVARGSLADDLAEVAAALSHGLQHHEAGRVSEALWWWQFSYLSGWGQRAAMAMRVLQVILGHARLDADADTVAEAQFDALHAEDGNNEVLRGR